jgi:hypothetical protein
MEHQFIETEKDAPVVNRVLFQQDNNLDQRDNLHELPETAAVYAICGRVNNQAANCRYVGETENLRQAVRAHFSPLEPYESLRNFMQSIKIKELVYQPMPASTREEREQKKQEWESRYRPAFTDERNRIY